MFSGGGTAGHVTPKLALIPHISKGGWNVRFVGAQGGMERGLTEPLSRATYHGVRSGKPRRNFDLKNFTDPLRAIRDAAEAAVNAVRAVFQGRVCIAAGGIRRVAAQRAGRAARERHDPGRWALLT